MTYLLIIFVIALALAPLSHFMPSKHQRMIAGLREYAALNGLFVEFRNLPGSDLPGSVLPGSVKGPGHSDDKDVIYYGKRLPPSIRKRARCLAWVRDGLAWRGLDRKEPAPAPLAGLPGEILAASIDESSCGVYWRESGGQEVLDQIKQALEAWSGELPA